MMDAALAAAKKRPAQFLA